MKLLLYVSVLAAIYVLQTSLLATEEVFSIVHAKVEKVTQEPPPPDTRDEADLLEGTPPPVGGNAWIAELRIEHVFSGDMSFVNQVMYQNTRNEIPLGNSNPIVPLLSKGDEGLFAILRFSDGTVGSPAYGLPAIPEGQLPLIKGRHSGYEAAMRRLMPDEMKSAKKLPIENSVPTTTSTSHESSRSIVLASLIKWGVASFVLALAYLIFRPKKVKAR